MPLRINNSPSVLEPIFIAIIAVTALVSSSYLALAVTMDNPLASPLPWVVAPVAVLLVYIVIKRARNRAGKLSIDVDHKLFTLDGDTFHPYADLTYYKSGLIQTPVMKMFQSRMTITVGTSKKNSYTIMDDRSSLIGSVKNSPNELDALEELINESSITDQQKASFGHWVARARLNLRQK